MQILALGNSFVLFTGLSHRLGGLSLATCQPLAVRFSSVFLIAGKVSKISRFHKVGIFVSGFKSSLPVFVKQIILLVLTSVALISTDRPSLAATAAKQTEAGLAESKTQEKLATGKPTRIQNAHKTSSSGKISSFSKTLNNRRVMPPEQFFGQAAIGYAAAKQCSEICAKLFCYCGCDHTHGHNSLLDCFTCLHGVNCEICQEEAVDALRLKHEGKSLGEIQKYIDHQYAKQYKDIETLYKTSLALKKYKAARLYRSNHDPIPETKLETNSSKNLAKYKGAGSGGCCSGKKSR